jgi:peptidoglycan hydrolase-like protein with peptidoglycan-binding domain
MLGYGETADSPRPLRVRAAIAGLLVAAALVPGVPALAAPDDDGPDDPAPVVQPEPGVAVADTTAAAAEPCSVARSLRRGDTGLDVLCLERDLVRRGFTIAFPNQGRYDTTTAAAIRTVQRRGRILVTGVAGPATLARLGLWSGPRIDVPCSVARVVRGGTRGAGARCVEQRLIQLGYDIPGPNEHFGALSVRATKAFQSFRGNTIVNGVAAPWTLRQLGLWSGPSLTWACRVSRPVLEGTRAGPARCLEQRLIQLGYVLEAPDGVFDAAATRILRAYQRRIGVTADGRAGKLVLSALGIWQQPPRVTCRVKTTVKWGSTGPAAKCVERRLVALGYALYGPNRTFDSSSVDAIRAYQQSKGLTVDGVAGPFTLYSLKIWGGRNPYAPPPLPANSGTGRRVVYSRAQQRVWAVDGAGRVVKTHLVSGRLHEPYAGTYSVFSRSEHTFNVDDPNVKWHWMVRFAYGPEGGNIGFHEIPTRFGVPLQSESQLGQPLSGGCVRQSTADALWMWNWAYLGTKVVVL